MSERPQTGRQLRSEVVANGRDSATVSLGVSAEGDIFGTCDERFAPVRDAVREQLAAGQELGVSLVVDVGGRTVVDLWGGWRDAERSEPWQQDTIVNVWSAGKTVTSLAALILADRGFVDLHEPVAKHWPEFAANGKEGVEVRELLGHTSGLSGWEAPFGLEELYDSDLATSRLAAQAPWWEPGTASGYHAQTQGFLIGELVRRTTGKTLTEFVATEMAGPLEADYQIGAAEADWKRVATIVPPPPVAMEGPGLDLESVAGKTLSRPLPGPEIANTPAWRGAEIGAVNGHGNARSLARLVRVLALGGAADGTRLLSPQTIELIFEEQSHGVDLVLGIPLRFGIGWALPESETVPYVPSGRVCYWGGWGGSLVVSDVDRQVTISYMMNGMAPGIIGSDRSKAYVESVYRCLDA